MASNISIDPKRDRLVIIASSLGTVFEWYDFFVYGTLAALFGKLFFPAASESAGFLLALATFGVGFGLRPVGAVVFGVLGDRLGRKYTFLVTIALMGIATAGIGFLPTYAQAGIAAPVMLVILRGLQGLALGGEYGGAAIYVAEHAPAKRRGLYTSFVQGSVTGGFILSLAVVLGTTALIGKANWEAWGWRVPFIVSLLLLGISLWIRLKLSESPVFQAMKAAGETAKNPLRESCATPARVGRMLVVMIGVAGGLTVIFYTAYFQSLFFLRNGLHVDDQAAMIIVGAGSISGLFWPTLFGWLSDRVGRKPVILASYVIALLLLFPVFHQMAGFANPSLTSAMTRNPVVVAGSDCTYDPFALHGQATACGKVLDALSKQGVAYAKIAGAAGAAPVVTIGGVAVDAGDSTALDAGLKAGGYDLAKVKPSGGATIALILCVVVLGCIAGAAYGPAASYMVELFPARVRYTSLSVPYHIGTGYFGGFLPFVSQYIVARTGNPFAGLWYTIAIVGAALVLLLLFLPETSGKDLN